MLSSAQWTAPQLPCQLEAQRLAVPDIEVEDLTACLGIWYNIHQSPVPLD